MLIFFQVSVRASLKLYVSVNNSSLRLAAFERNQLFIRQKQLVKQLTSHYVSGALFQAGES